jgi:hypothetical protein
MGLSVGLHGSDVLAHHAPGNALGTQEVFLWVGHDQRRASLFDLFDDWIVQGYASVRTCPLRAADGGLDYRQRLTRDVFLDSCQPLLTFDTATWCMPGQFFSALARVPALSSLYFSKAKAFRNT